MPFHEPAVVEAAFLSAMLPVEALATAKRREGFSHGLMMAELKTSGYSSLFHDEKP